MNILTRIATGRKIPKENYLPPENKMAPQRVFLRTRYLSYSNVAYLTTDVANETGVFLGVINSFAFAQFSPVLCIM